jgi:ABC-2 type transport system permease protein
MNPAFKSLIRKEVQHILRDPKTLFILFGLPVVQIIIFGFALTNEIKNTRIAVADLSRDHLSQRWIHEVESSRYFDVHRVLSDPTDAEAELRKGVVRAVVVIPAGFAGDVKHQFRTSIQVISDASDPNTASTIVNYLQAITADFQQQLDPLSQWPLTIRQETRMLYNPQLKGAYNFVPGVMAMVLMLVCTLMTSIAIVKEKETGTMEVLLVSPLKPVMVVIAKSIPYLALSAINIASILLLSVFVLGLPVAGSLTLLVFLSLLYTLTSLALGMFISSVTASQQTAMLISLMGMFLPTLMLSGFMFPIENMPVPLRIISNIVPAKWYFSIVKNVMIKGGGLLVVWKEALILFGMTVFFLTISIRKYSTRIASS